MELMLVIFNFLNVRKKNCKKLNFLTEKFPVIISNQKNFQLLYDPRHKSQTCIDGYV
jgi:hypothetical protein